MSFQVYRNGLKVFGFITKRTYCKIVTRYAYQVLRARAYGVFSGGL